MPNSDIPIVGTRKPDDDVGKPGAPAAGGGGQTAAQASITDMSPGGRSDADRKVEQAETPGARGRPPVVTGGSSGGSSDRKTD